MSLRKKKKELQRLLKSFEEEASKYHDLNFSVVYITPGWASHEDKLIESNHAIPLWQYYGKVSTVDSYNKLMSDVRNHNPMYGVPGAKFYSFGVLEGENIQLFLRIAKRAGNVFSEKESIKIKTSILDELITKDKSAGKPVFVANSNPAALWLNFVIFHSSISHPKRYSKTIVNLDPFAESLKAIEHLLENATIERSKKSSYDIDKIRFKVALSFPGEKREYVAQIARTLQDKLGNDKVFYDFDYKAHLARPNLDLLLQKIYGNNSELIAIFLCKEYDEKEWCGLEWRAIREIIKARNDKKVMFLRFDNSVVKGVFSIDGYIDLSSLKPEHAAKYIMQRIDLDEEEPGGA